jgi:hypothetical protein
MPVGIINEAKKKKDRRKEKRKKTHRQVARADSDAVEEKGDIALREVRIENISKE